MKRRLLLAVAFGVALCSLHAQAKPPKAPAKTPVVAEDGDDEAPLVLMVYDYSDIQWEMAGPSKGIDELGGDSALGGAGMLPPGVQGSFPGPQQYSGYVKNSVPCDDRGDVLHDAINGLILGPESSTVGGRSEVKVLGDFLAISTTEKKHQQIAAFLASLRQRTATRKMVAVEVHWLWLTEEQLKSLVPLKAGDDRATVRLNVDEAVWQRHAQERAKEDSDLRPGYHATVTCMNGQTVLANGGSQKRFISTMIPVVGDAVPPVAPRADSSPLPSQPSPMTGYQPAITTIQEGAAVQVKPIVCEGNHVLLDIHVRAVEVQQPDGGQPEPRPSSDLPAKADYRAGVVRELASVVERPIVLNHRLDTTLRVPLGRRVLVGGITRSVEPSQGEPNLYVFVEASLVDAQSAAPVLKQKR
jgi:hypothetical protein